MGVCRQYCSIQLFQERGWYGEIICMYRDFPGQLRSALLVIANLTQPALTPLLLVLEERLASRTRVPSASTLRSMSGAKTIWVAVLIAVFSCLNLLYWDHTNAVPAIIPAVALVPVYCALLPGTWKGSTSPLVRLEDDVAPVSVRTAFLLAVAFGTRTIIWGGFEVDAASAVLLGLFKASSWYTLVKTVHKKPLYVAFPDGSLIILYLVSMQLVVPCYHSGDLCHRVHPQSLRSVIRNPGGGARRDIFTLPGPDDLPPAEAA